MLYIRSVIWGTISRSRRTLHSVVLDPSIMVRGGENVKINQERSYEDAIHALNSLQTNAAVLDQIRKERGGRMQQDSLPEMARFMERIGIQVPELNKLNVIHVSGSKGKGSVCAMSESIMRHCGLRTGFYSSPHLLEVRERIRIDGRPLERHLFAKYFWNCWDKLQGSLVESDGKMPAYFRFLTLLAYSVFLYEKVDVAVVEVGVGGLFDCTNIIREPIVCGITRLELEHTAVLGDTIDKISWHKAGIMKFKRPAITIPQRPEAMKVLQAKSEEMKADLSIAPPLEKYTPELSAIGLEGDHQKVNASLALQLCRIWLQEIGNNRLMGKLPVINGCHDDKAELEGTERLSEKAAFALPAAFQSGLTRVRWPGRNQVISRKKCTFYLDGAHTSGSLNACARWYSSRKDTDIKLPRNDIFRVLVFNSTGDRDSRVLLQELKSLDFDYAVFCPNVVNGGLRNSDQMNFTVTRDKQLMWCERNQDTWLSLHGIVSCNSPAIDANSDYVAETTTRCSELTTVFSCISDAVRWILCGKEPLVEKPPQWCPEIPQRLTLAQHVQILVTGSLHLVGGVMKFLGPEMVDLV